MQCQSSGIYIILEIFLFIKCGQVKIECGVSGRGRKRDREKQINRVRDGAWERFGNGVG
jgi:hypothetical protein